MKRSLLRSHVGLGGRWVLALARSEECTPFAAVARVCHLAVDDQRLVNSKSDVCCPLPAVPLKTVDLPWQTDGGRFADTLTGSGLLATRNRAPFATLTRQTRWSLCLCIGEE